MQSDDPDSPNCHDDGNYDDLVRAQETAIAAHDFELRQIVESIQETIDSMVQSMQCAPGFEDIKAEECELEVLENAKRDIEAWRMPPAVKVKTYSHGLPKVESQSFAGIADRTGWHLQDQLEPADHIQWTDEAGGYPCVIIRNTTLGFLYGYVGVPEGHPAHDVEAYDMRTCEGDYIDVHGGLIYSQKPRDLSQWIKGDDSEKFATVQWLGFDCGHLGDAKPGGLERPGPDSVYVTPQEVQRMVHYLAKELHRLETQEAGKEMAWRS